MTGHGWEWYSVATVGGMTYELSYGRTREVTVGGDVSLGDQLVSLILVVLENLCLVIS
jgi:hypothetical protein